MDIQNLPGTFKVAVIIHSLGMDAAAPIINRMDENQKIQLKQHLENMGDIPNDIIEKISQEFLTNLKNGGGVRRSVAEKKQRKDLEDTKGEKDRNTVKRIKALENLEPDQIVELIKEEHPQTIAAIALHLDSGVASEVISALPDDIIVDVSLRVANLDKILPGMIDEINTVFQEILSNKRTSVVQKTSGVAQLAEILNYSDQIIAEQILSDIEKNNPELAEEIKQRMFVFEDLILIDDKGMQKILRKVETSELALALKGASDEVKYKIFNNMSKRAAEMLGEEIETLGAVRMKDVEIAQQAINKIIQEMASNNEIVITGRGGEQFIA
jgi:flagellar motor switch protein FliG